MNKLKEFLKNRFHQEGTLIIFILISMILFFLFNHVNKQSNKFGNVTGGVIINPQAHLYQGAYVRGATGITQNWRGEVGVFKEITPHLEIETGVGIKNEKERNSAEAIVGLRVKF